MEKMVLNDNNKEDHAAALSWCWNSHNNDLHRSQWLQDTLSELNDKIKVMVSMIEEDGDSFAKRAEMFYQRRPEIIKILEDLHKSYRCLAEKYDHLKSGLSQAIHSTSFSSLKSLRQVHSSTNQMSTMMINTADDVVVVDDDRRTLRHKATAANHHHSRLDETKIDYECLMEKRNKFEYDDDGDGDSTIIIRGGSSGGGEEEGYDYKKKTWSINGKEVTELVEDHTRQIGELIRRNKEKRETIKDLRYQINRLIGENQALKDCLHSLKPSSNRFKSSSFFGKLAGCTGSTI